MKSIFYFIFLFSSLAFSQTNGITYQAVIYNPADPNGSYAPLTNQNVCLQFSVLASDGTTVEYQEQVNVSTDVFGMVNLLIGTNTQIGGTATDFDQIQWTSDAKSLKVELDINGNCSNFEELSNKPFNYVPFAYYSRNNVAGPQGDEGDNGDPGPSAYEVWLAAGNSGNESDFLASIVGNGIASTTQSVSGTLTLTFDDGSTFTTSDLTGPQGNGIASTTQNVSGTLTLAFDDGTEFTTSDLTGPQGEIGLTGPSAYEVWLAAGNTGEESDFLDSIVGNGVASTTQSVSGTLTFTFDDGSTFSTSDLTGPQGPQGEIGPQGDIGDPGLSAYQVWLTEPANADKDESVFLESLIGNGVASVTQSISSGVLTFTFDDESTFTTSDLTGPQGLTGLQGPQGEKGDPGLSAYQVWLTQTGNTGDESVFLDSIVGNGVASTTQSVSSGVLTFTFDDGSTFTTSDLTGPQGATGPQGPKGQGGVTSVGDGLELTGTGTISDTYILSLGGTEGQTLQVVSGTATWVPLTDSDVDGIWDAQEGYNSENPSASTDSDGDGTPDYLESNTTDTDGDGVNDKDDSDNTSGDNDSDGDGESNAYETANGSDPNVASSTSGPDSDLDGISDAGETTTADSDGDDTPDYLESNILDADGDGVYDQFDSDDTSGNHDSDEDGETNAYETANGSDPADPNSVSGPDTDSDGLSDAKEGFNSGTPSASLDSDRDVIPDYLESNILDTDGDGVYDNADRYNTLGDNDSDGDGQSNAYETANGSDPNDAVSISGTDFDKDGISDAIETTTADSDSDGVPDYKERNIDDDSNGTADHLDPSNDSDRDGVANNQEASDGTDPLDPLDFVPPPVYCTNDSADPSAGPTPVVEVTGAGGRIWMDRNLGAARVAEDGYDAQAYGDLYQWGRRSDGHQCRNSVVSSAGQVNIDMPDHGDYINHNSKAPYDWRNPSNNNLWQNGQNDPCPVGFRLPTEQEFIAEYTSWSSSAGFESPLKLTYGPGRQSAPLDASYDGSYWTSTAITGDKAKAVRLINRKWDGSFDENNRPIFTYPAEVFTNDMYRFYGFHVRCIKKQ